MTLDLSAGCGTMRRMVTVTRPPSNVIATRNAHIQYLCDRAREDEIEQYLAITGAPKYDADTAAAGFIGTPGLRFTLLGPDGYPACVGGYQEVAKGVWQSWMVGSPEGWEKGWRSITKGARWLMDGILSSEMGGRRLQTNCLASRTKAIEWYERGLGLAYEGTWRKFGAQGQDFACFARVKED